jgi:hypothetical protein
LAWAGLLGLLAAAEQRRQDDRKRLARAACSGMNNKK